MLQTIVFLMNTLMEYCSKTIFKSGRAEKLYMEIQKRLHLDQQNLKWEKSVHDILEVCGHDEYSIIVVLP
ncbi:uncharacterized protein LOC111026895 isoform X2 [Myzus persicae]|uniref:uncharacterized protein LOC111026895 isoform X2 n=1 Tax=Myzus persicae TaxID=13164 RepID=UPI000B9329D8|nr:uncharacterized protein LOC111026895 isoform X2 [Myzus persicae]